MERQRYNTELQGNLFWDEERAEDEYKKEMVWREFSQEVAKDDYVDNRKKARTVGKSVVRSSRKSENNFAISEENNEKYGPARDSI